MVGGSLGLYLHVPFCQAICSYCNFNRGLFDATLKARYVDALEREIRTRRVPVPHGEPDPDSRRAAARSSSGDTPPAADTIFFGGGTPSLLDPHEIERLIRACADSFALDPRAEITLETNPETATAERLEGFRRAGVTRLSFGVQSFDDDELARLGRIHSAARAKAAIGLAKAAGFTDVSFDLMLWLPGQSIDTWLSTVDQAIECAPDHLSLYLLELYPNAPLKESLQRGAVDPQAADDDAAAMYLRGLERLDTAGFEQYEISNVARPGHQSRHNVKYWQGGHWQGFGCGAHSTIDGVRWKNVAGTSEYVDRVAIEAPVDMDAHRLSERERLEERLFTGLRLSEGISRQEISGAYGIDPWLSHEAELAPLLDVDLMWRGEDRFGLTRRGMLVANEILTAFI